MHLTLRERERERGGGRGMGLCLSGQNAEQAVSFTNMPRGERYVCSHYYSYNFAVGLPFFKMKSWGRILSARK